ncbi:MAG: YidB family protein [Geminicoccaceae bacterium]
MSILDQLLGGLGGQQGGSPIQSVLLNLLTSQLGTQGGQMGQTGQMGGAMGQGGGFGGGLGGLASAAMGSGGLAAGLGALLSRFEGAGLGNVAQSWVGNGPNQSISPQQLQNVLGQDQVQSMASQAGMQPQDLLSQLSQHLPTAVDRLTPNGRLPDEGTVSV